MVAAFDRYEEKGGAESSSVLAQAREALFVKSGLDGKDIARRGISMAMGQVTLVSTAYTTLARITNYPGLADRIRDEIASQGLGFNVARTAEECPLLLSTMHETLRLGGTPKALIL